MLLSGAVSFFHEVLWTRMLSHVLGSSIHAFGVMVASFLAGIALGGGVGAWLARTRTWADPGVRAEPARLRGHGGAPRSSCSNASCRRRIGSPQPPRSARSILLPLTFFIGITFPLAVRILAEQRG